MCAPPGIIDCRAAQVRPPDRPIARVQWRSGSLPWSPDFGPMRLALLYCGGHASRGRRGFHRFNRRRRMVRVRCRRAREGRSCLSIQANQCPSHDHDPHPPPNALGRSSTEPTTNPPTHRPPPHPRARRRSLCVSVAEVRKRLGHDDEMGYAPTAARCCEQSPGPDPSHTHTQVQQIIPAGGRSQRSNKHARSPPPPPCPCAAPTAPEPYQQQSQPQGDALAAAAAAPAGSPSSR